MATKFDFLSPGVNIREIDRSILPAQAQEPGPVLIGRARKGPALKPVLINSYEDFVTIFGEPVLGTAGTNSDIWRQGNILGPQYAGIAAQAHLASQTSPVTFVRLLGDEHDSATTLKAGWTVNSPSADVSSNATAYGLFLIDSGSEGANPTGVLGAVFYATAGAITLSGTIAGTSNKTSSAGTLIESSVDQYGFQLDVWNSSANGSTPTESFTFNFDRSNPSYYIRSMLNTNPVLTNSDIVSTTKTYWLGETFERSISDTLVSSSAGKVYGIVLPLVKANDSKNWGDRQSKYEAAKSGWVIAQDTGPAASYSPQNAEKLFRFVALHEGDELQKEVMIAIENISAPVDVTVDEYASFDVSVVDMAGNALETMAACNLNPQSDNYIVKKFGDTEFEWREDERRYRVKGDEPNASNYFRVVVKDIVANGNAGGLIPFGFYGPARPKGFTLAYGSKGANNFGETTNAGNAHVVTLTFGDGSGNGGHGTAGQTFALNFPDRTLTVELTNGGTNETAFGESVADKMFIDIAIQNSALGVASTVRTALVGEGASSLGLTTIPALVISNVNDRKLTLTAIANGVFDFTVTDNMDNFAAVVDTTGTDDDDFAKAFVKGNATMPFPGGDANRFAKLPVSYSGSFKFPSLALRKSGSEGSPVSEYEVYYGIRPKTAASETRNDPGYIDYLRGLPGTITSHDITDTDSYEYSFVFSLDDLRVDTNLRTVSYESGLRAAGLSYTAKSGSSALLGDDTGITDGVEIKQFLMPIWGGKSGLDVTEKEPFRNKGILAAASQTDINNAMLYSVNLAIDSVKDNEQVIANTLSIPGVTATRVTDKIISTCENRKDMLGVIDLESAYVPITEDSTVEHYSVATTVNEVKKRKLNSSYGCAFHPWVQLSTNTGTASGKLWVPPSVAAIGAFAKSTSQSELWFAPAGFTRGGLSPLGGVGGPRVVNVREALSSKDRDLLYKYNINPIASFPGEGIVVFGQKTLQAFASALDRINVRRLLIYLKYELSNISRRLLFEPNVQVTWNRFKAQADGVLSNVQANLGVTEYKIVLDESTTTADLIDRNILYAKIYIKPTRAIEYIVVDLIVTNTGAEFV